MLQYEIIYWEFFLKEPSLKFQIVSIFSAHAATLKMKPGRNYIVNSGRKLWLSAFEMRFLLENRDFATKKICILHKAKAFSAKWPCLTRDKIFSLLPYSKCWQSFPNVLVTFSDYGTKDNALRKVPHIFLKRESFP